MGDAAGYPSEGWVVWTILSSLGENGFFSIVLRFGQTPPKSAEEARGGSSGRRGRYGSGPTVEPGERGASARHFPSDKLGQ